MSPDELRAIILPAAEPWLNNRALMALQQALDRISPSMPVDSLSALARFQRARADCEAARHDEAAFSEAITALGLVAWNVAQAIESALSTAERPEDHPRG